VAIAYVLLAAHARGLAGYWRTPGVLRTSEGRAAVGVPDSERVLGLVHLGQPRQDRQAPERLPPSEYVTFLP
jgi:nitroreductase